MIIGTAGGVDPGEIKEGDPKGRRGREETLSESSSSNDDEEVIRHAKIEDSVEEVSTYDMEQVRQFFFESLSSFSLYALFFFLSYL